MRPVRGPPRQPHRGSGARQGRRPVGPGSGWHVRVRLFTDVSTNHQRRRREGVHLRLRAGPLPRGRHGLGRMCSGRNSRERRGIRSRKLRRVAMLVLVLGVRARVAGACSSVDQTHARWTALLARRVDQGRVDYAGLARDDQAALDTYLATLSGTCAADYERWTQAERIAFWLNAYNAFTVRLVLDHYTLASIRQIGWLPLAAFRERFIPMEDIKGDVISLNDIEHGTLRSEFHEPRIHFALVCAARSCPALRPEAYRGADLDQQLDDQGRTFLRDPTK